jgi:dTDP-4-dehydrorhamnose reductase
MKSILITGHKGMLGRELFAIAEHLNWNPVGFDRPAHDLTDRRQIEDVVNETAPRLIVHGAAYTAVDRAESEPELAMLVNGIGTQHVCLAAQKLDIPVLYVSTDYIFDGRKETPYDEWDAANPQGVYGRTKYAGEWFVRTLCPRHFIVRVSWLCGHGGANFVETIVKLSRERDELKVVNDQHGSPTFVRDVAPELLRLAESGMFGTYHITNQGCTTWHGFATKIVELTGAKCRVLPCATEEFPRPAPRPRNSRMSPTLYELAISNRMPTWEDGLARYIAEGMRAEG